MDTVFIATLVCIFVATIVTAFLRARAKDCCLKDFHGFDVTVEENGKRVSGRLSVYSSGVELIYREPECNAEGAQEFSYIIYANQLPDIKAIYRYHDELTDENKRRRDAELRKAYHPNIFRRSWRWLRNAVNTLRDAIVEALGLAMGRLKPPSGALSVVTQQKARITGVGKEVIGQMARAYEPILERYIGRRVVVEVNKGDEGANITGILKEYSDKFVELLDVSLKEEITIPIPGKRENIEATLRDGVCEVTNAGRTPITIKSVKVGEEVHELNEEVKAGTMHSFELKKEDDSQPASMFVVRERTVDIIFPRNIATVRHGAEEHASGLLS